MLQILFRYAGNALTLLCMAVFMVSYWLDACNCHLYERKRRHITRE